MGWKKYAIGGTLLAMGSVGMFEYLILDKTVLQGLDEQDAAYVAYLALHGKSYPNLEEYRKRKSYF